MVKNESRKREQYARVAVGLPIDQLFDYLIPDPLTDAVKVGMRVLVPFRNREKIGYVVGLAETTTVDQIKPIIAPLGDEPLLRGEMLELTSWIAHYYFSSWGEVIESALPKEVVEGRKSRRRKKGEGESFIDPLDEEPIPLELTPHQQRALERLKGRILSQKFSVTLLHGVTGSGKTEIYMGVISQALDLGKQALLLVPEIALTPQLIARVKGRFREQVALLHSGLGGGERAEEWKRAYQGAASIVVGVRSAIFAPLERLGVIIIDEEHDPSYKQGETPRYHARDVGIMRGRLVGCPVILGSATPSLESAYNAKIGKYHYLHLPERVESRSLPLMEIVDMGEEVKREKGVAILSSRLREAIRERLERGEQILLFLNRRGFARFIQCEECGWAFQCPNCSVTLIYHMDEEGMVCHYCGYVEPAKDFCPHCRGFRLHPYGIGIERVEEEAKASFPKATVARMDRDTTRGRSSHARILREFFRGKIHILVGTQMVAKGHDFPNITLVGVISADSSLHLPDFRASERTFQLLTQVGGRAGRGEKGGEVIVQTYHPHHFSIQRAQAYDFPGFYEAEVALRKELRYPPYSRIIAITLEGGNSATVERMSHMFEQILQSEKKTGKALEILGPSKAMLWKLKNRFRWQIMLKGADVAQMHTLLRKGFERFKRDHSEGRGVNVIIDVDPQQFF